LRLVKVVTDSTAQLDPDFVEEFGITVVPLEISFGAQKFREGTVWRTAL
jgi:fatty acid-binding protein DegV